VILLENKEKCPTSRHVAGTLKILPRNREVIFLFKSVRCCESVAITRDRTQWFIVEVGSSNASRSAATKYVNIETMKRAEVIRKVEE